jgi:hypothetical protein
VVGAGIGAGAAGVGAGVGAGVDGWGAGVEVVGWGPAARSLSDMLFSRR